MSLLARQQLVNSPRTIFQNDSQRNDLLDITVTNTNLIELLLFLIEKGHILCFTAIKSDHHDDTDLNPNPPYIGTHWHGWAVDCWPLNSTDPTDYMDANSREFRVFLNDVAHAPCLHQIGLAGEAALVLNFTAAGPTAFSDDGGDHVHIGAK